MLTKEKVLEAIKGGRESECLDGRDYSRLCEFFPHTDWETLGFKPYADAPDHEPKEWNRDNVVAQLQKDVAFGFEKALNRRGISSSFMHSVVNMWLWVLEDELHDGDPEADYAEYGLPLLKKVAVKFGFPNPIGDNYGNEHKYSAEAETED